MADNELFGNSEQLETHDKRVETHACDLISRQAALDEKNVVHMELFGRDFPVVPVATLKGLPPAQPTEAETQKMQDIEQAALRKAYECGKQDAMQWILCEERLPEPGVNVLVDVLDIPADDRFPLVDKIGDDGDWCNCYGEWFAVAWMPIPDPWKGEDDG